MTHPSFDDLVRENRRATEMFERMMKPFQQMENAAEAMRRASRFDEMVSRIHTSPQFLAEFNQHLGLRQELATVIDRMKPDIPMTLETSRLIAAKENLVLPDAVIAPMQQLQESQRLYGDVFRKPYLQEAEERFSAIQASLRPPSAAAALQETLGTATSAALAAFLPGQEEFARLTDAIETPWVNSTQALSSFESVARLAVLGNAIHAAPFEAGSSRAICTLLGDWSDTRLPKKIFSDWQARQNFYYRHGFDHELTRLPEPAFTESLYETGILRPELFPLGVPLPVPESEEEHTETERLAKQRMLDSYDILFNLETKLREFLYAVLTEKCGEKWEKRRVPGDMRRQWEGKRQKAQDQREEEQRLLWYADFTDYEKLILRADNWNEVFQEIFRNKTDWGVSFQRLYPIRLSVMHARFITQEDFLLLAVEAQRLLRAIRALENEETC